MREVLGKFMCLIGLHSKKRVKMAGCNYRVCRRCRSGDPVISREF